MQTFSELVVAIPGQGLVTLYRAKTPEKAKSFQQHNDLSFFEGRKVSMQEVKGEYIQPKLGWVYEPKQERGLRYVH